LASFHKMDNVGVIFDCRRHINSGVGRVSQWLAIHSKQLVEAGDCHYLVREGTMSEYCLNESECIRTSIIPFSSEEFHILPSFLSETNTILYVNPQTTWSPLHKVKSLNIVHDLWALENPSWLPSEQDLLNRFNLRNLNYFTDLIDWFLSKDPKEFLTRMAYERFAEAMQSKNLILQGAWAQYAAIARLSSSIVAVSEPIKEKLEALFKSDCSIHVIPNIPKSFTSRLKGKPRHLLTLSKLEQRKNLFSLLDAYLIYAEKCTDLPLPLVIAGDPGYSSEARSISDAVNNLVEKGHNITILHSVSDSKLSELLHDAACLVFPSYYEGFGLPSLEAMLANVPVVATSTGIMTSILGNHAFLADPYDPQDIANSIIRSLSEGACPSRLELARVAVTNYMDQIDAVGLWKEAISSALAKN